jgi:hypothetical protein
MYTHAHSYALIEHVLFTKRSLDITSNRQLQSATQTSETRQSLPKAEMKGSKRKRETSVDLIDNRENSAVHMLSATSALNAKEQATANSSYYDNIINYMLCQPNAANLMLPPNTVPPQFAPNPYMAAAAAAAAASYQWPAPPSSLSGYVDTHLRDASNTIVRINANTVKCSTSIYTACNEVR